MGKDVVNSIVSLDSIATAGSSAVVSAIGTVVNQISNFAPEIAGEANAYMQSNMSPDWIAGQIRDSLKEFAESELAPVSGAVNKLLTSSDVTTKLQQAISDGKNSTDASLITAAETVENFIARIPSQYTTLTYDQEVAALTDLGDDGFRMLASLGLNVESHHLFKSYPQFEKVAFGENNFIAASTEFKEESKTRSAISDGSNFIANALTALEIASKDQLDNGWRIIFGSNGVKPGVNTGLSLKCVHGGLVKVKLKTRLGIGRALGIADDIAGYDLYHYEAEGAAERKIITTTKGAEEDWETEVYVEKDDTLVLNIHTVGTGVTCTAAILSVISKCSNVQAVLPDRNEDFLGSADTRELSLKPNVEEFFCMLGEYDKRHTEQKGNDSYMKDVVTGLRTLSQWTANNLPDDSYEQVLNPEWWMNTTHNDVPKTKTIYNTKYLPALHALASSAMVDISFRLKR
jgi:hypothetical protein